MLKKDQPKSFSALQIIRTHYPKRTGMVPGIVPHRGLVLVAGKPKSGKTSLGLDLAIEVAKGGRVFNASKVQRRGGEFSTTKWTSKNG